MHFPGKIHDSDAIIALQEASVPSVINCYALLLRKQAVRCRHVSCGVQCQLAQLSTLLPAGVPPAAGQHRVRVHERQRRMGGTARYIGPPASVSTQPPHPVHDAREDRAQRHAHARAARTARPGAAGSHHRGRGALRQQLGPRVLQSCHCRICTLASTQTDHDLPCSPICPWQTPCT